MKRPSRWLLLLVLLLWTHHPAILIDASCDFANLKLDTYLSTYPEDKININAAVIACWPGLANLVPSGTTCNFTTLCYNKGAFMATMFLCFDGQWRWSPAYDNSSFCPAWKHCEWNQAVRSVYCDHNNDPTAVVATRGPALWDHEIQSITIINNAITSLQIDMFTEVANLLHLNLTYNQITQIVSTVLSSQQQLKSIDLSNNLLPLLNASALPINGAVQYVDLRNNIANLSLAYQALDAPLSTCSGIQPILLLDEPLCNITHVNSTSCYRVRCQSNVVPIYWDCDGIAGHGMVDDRSM